MAEPFGIAAGAIGVATAFTACVDCFGFVQLGRHFGRDFQTDILALDCARLRLTRWGTAVAVYDDPRLGRPNATELEIRNVRDTLHQVLVLFADSEKISKKYSVNAKNAQYLAVLAPNELDPAVMALSNKMRDLAVRRQKSNSLIKKTSWALYHRSELKELVKEVTNMIDNIEKLFPAPKERELELVQQETAKVHEKAELELAAVAADGVDSVLHAASKEVLTGNRYLKVVIEGKAHTGDSFSKDWRGPALSTNSTYEYVRVAEGGKAQIGNRYGEKDFWDD